MSDRCVNCDCDSPPCPKKGNAAEIIETSYVEEVVVVKDAPAAEHDGKCKCGESCACADCRCDH